MRRLTGGSAASLIDYVRGLASPKQPLKVSFLLSVVTIGACCAQWLLP
jgi:hypothetical protein